MTLLGQGKDTWTSFWNKDTTLVGFKDKNGVVRIRPRFTGLLRANKFDEIMGVTEKKNKSWESYYLTKSGRIVGRNNLYVYDNGADCESEGFIRFRDNKTHKVGMFDRNGNIAIPAHYNNLSMVMNGLIIAHQDAHWDEKKRSEVFPYPWIGGKYVLINTHNKTLIDSFYADHDLNYYTLRISTSPDPDTVRRNFKAQDQRYYSFIDFDKEFTAWLKTSLLDNFTKENLLNAAYRQIAFWKEPDGWVSDPKSSFINRNFDLIKTKLLQLNSKECDYHIFNEGLNPFIYEAEEYKHYFNTCGEPKEWLYPVKTIVINYKDKMDLLQDHFEFLRTDKGYKLISISIGIGKPK